MGLRRCFFYAMTGGLSTPQRGNKEWNPTLQRVRWGCSGRGASGQHGILLCEGTSPRAGFRRRPSRALRVARGDFADRGFIDPELEVTGLEAVDDDRAQGTVRPHDAGSGVSKKKSEGWGRPCASLRPLGRGSAPIPVLAPENIRPRWYGKR